jgi:uncharacterized membrane protein
LPEETDQPQPEAPATAPKSGGDNNLIAAVSYLWILSIVILLVKKDSDYVTFHARQGVVLFAASVIISIVSFIVPFLFLITWLLQLIIFVAVVVGFIQALGGKRYKMPVVGDLAEKVNL